LGGERKEKEPEAFELNGAVLLRLFHLLYYVLYSFFQMCLLGKSINSLLAKKKARGQFDEPDFLIYCLCNSPSSLIFLWVLLLFTVVPAFSIQLPAG